MSTIDVFIDTNALPKEPSKFGNAFIKRLCLLSKMKVLSVYLSNVVVQEWKTQMKEIMEGNIKNAIGAIKKLKSNSWFDEGLAVRTLNETEDYLSKAVPEINMIVETKVDVLLNEMDAKILPVKAQHGINVVNDYFNGTPPFKNAKSREDFPDSFIYQCAKDLVSKEDHEIHCITKDKTLGGALSAMEGVTVYKSIYDFLNSKTIEKITQKIKEELWWREAFVTLKPALPNLSKDIQNKLEAILIDEVTYKYVEHPEIPSDTNEAIIEGIYETIDIEMEWDEIESIGPKIISLPFSLTCDADLEFPIYRMNAYDVPEGVRVSYGDPEEDHYFDAYGSVTLRINGIMSLEFNTETYFDPELPAIEGVRIEKFEIYIVENSSNGSIF